MCSLCCYIHTLIRIPAVTGVKQRGMYSGGVANFGFFLLYGMPAPSAECQHPEAWPDSTYGHLRGVSDNKNLLSRTLLDNKKLLSGTLPDNNLFQFFSDNKVYFILLRQEFCFMRQKLSSLRDISLLRKSS